MAWEPFIRVWQRHGKPGRCKWCRRRIVWERTSENKLLPFNPGRPVVRVDVHPEKQIPFDVLDEQTLHKHTCTKRPRKKPKPAPAAVQERLL